MAAEPRGSRADTSSIGMNAPGKNDCRRELLVTKGILVDSLSSSYFNNVRQDLWEVKPRI